MRFYLLHTFTFLTTENVFVPILRAEDNCSFPKLGAPSPDLVISGHIVDRSSPEDPQYKISAYAGPMSPQEVQLRFEIYFIITATQNESRVMSGLKCEAG